MPPSFLRCDHGCIFAEVASSLPRQRLKNLLLPGKPPGRPWLSLNDPVNLMLLLETFPQEYNSPAKSCNGTAPYPVRAMRSCNPSLHLKPAATGVFPVSEPTDMRIRPLEPLWHLRGLALRPTGYPGRDPGTGFPLPRLVSETRPTMSCRPETPCDCHAGTAACTPSTNLTRFRHMMFGRYVLGGASSVTGFASRAIRQPPAPVSVILSRPNRALRLVPSPRAGNASTPLGHLTCRPPRAGLIRGCPVSLPERFRVGWFSYSISLLQLVRFTDDAQAPAELRDLFASQADANIATTPHHTTPPSTPTAAHRSY
ncbi:hypothetical protein Purlil1_13495 [Purpureocillium lilacinum]|uniref:Uncharacterized protein n=1 Tax=Purpureocillium lilacinum TaxID=33203 RepID=A0ABR0BDX8_PURLI|nr:hypothetical protein Purlil1_13495 [Purpureocillium lilacinum]